MRGIKSEGMILAATSAEGKVELLLPPVGSKPGDRVFVEGIDEGMFVPDAVLNPKVKIIESVKETLEVDSNGIATWDKKALIMEKGLGHLSVPSIRNSPVG